MANTARESRPVVVGHGQEPVRLKSVGDTIVLAAARALWATAMIYLIGSIADLAILWGVNADWSNPMWEFTALDRSVAGAPRIVLALALIWTSMHIAGGTSMIWHRVMATTLVVIGILGGVAAAMMASDYFVLRGAIQPQEQAVFASVVVKTAILGGLFMLLLVPIGVMGWRRSRR